MKTMQKRVMKGAGLLFFILVLYFSPLFTIKAGEDVAGWDVPFSGIGSDHITFRTYLTFNIYDEDEDPEHLVPLNSRPLELKSDRKNTKVEGIYYLEYQGVSFLNFDNRGNECRLSCTPGCSSLFYDYIYYGGYKKCRNYCVVMCPVIKVYSRDGNHVGPYNGTGWKSLEECEAAGFSVTVDPGAFSVKGTGRDGKILNGRYALNDAQIKNIRDEFNNRWEVVISPIGVTRRVKYNANGGTCPDSSNNTYYEEFIVDDMNPECTGEATRTGYYFLGWSDTKYAVDKGPDDYYEMYHPGDWLCLWEDTTLYAVWGTKRPGDTGPAHTHNYTRRSFPVYRCAICGEYIYRYVYTCSCGDEGESGYVAHECPPGRIIYANGECSVCGEIRMSGHNVTVTGQYQVIRSIEDTDLEFPGHMFLGWNTAPDGNGSWYSSGASYAFSERGQTLTLYAIWKPMDYRIHFDYGEERLVDTSELVTGVDSMKVSYDDYMSVLPLPRAKGFTFEGWYSAERDLVMTENMRYGLAGDSTFEALWRGHSVTVAADPDFPADSESRTIPTYFKMKDSIFEVDYGGYYSRWLPLELFPSCTGYDFAGWTLRGEIVDNDSRCLTDETHIIKGRWRAKDICLTLDPGEGGFPGRKTGESITVTVIYGKILTGNASLPAPEREGYRFAGWFTGRNKRGDKVQNGEKILIGDDRTLYATWEPKEYKVTLEYCENWKYPAKDLRGNEVSEIRVIYGETIPDLPEPSRYGYDFLGWSSEYVYDPEHDAINGKKDAKTFTRGSAWETAGNAVLYAVWEPVSVIVEYDYNYDYTTDIPIIWED